MKTPFAGFPPEALRFLRQLKRNNNRDWFLQNRETYEQKVKQPMLEIVEQVGNLIQGLAPELNTDPQKAMFRIYRDTRFSPDKTPYKTQVAAHFSPRTPVKRKYAGLYFHIEPGEVLVAAGVYMPGPAELRELRTHIASHADELRMLLRKPRLAKFYGGLQGEQISRPPRGFPADHPDVDLLRYKNYIVWTGKPAALAQTPELFGFVVEGFIAAIPLIRFLNAPLGIKV
jgi:uncharacterized protein (TIGR02453 family)